MCHGCIQGNGIGLRKNAKFSNPDKPVRFIADDCMNLFKGRWRGRVYAIIMHPSPMEEALKVTLWKLRMVFPGLSLGGNERLFVFPCSYTTGSP